MARIGNLYAALLMRSVASDSLNLLSKYRRDRLSRPRMTLKSPTISYESGVMIEMGASLELHPNHWTSVP